MRVTMTPHLDRQTYFSRESQHFGILALYGATREQSEEFLRWADYLEAQSRFQITRAALEVS